MLDTIQLGTALQGIVGLYPGFKNPSLPASFHRRPVYYLSDAHRILRTDVVASLIVKPEDVLASTYDAAKSYARYELAKSGDDLYESQADDNQANLITNATYWLKTTPLSAWYAQVVRGAVNKVASELVLSPGSPMLVTRTPLFNTEGNLSGVLSKSSRFLAYRLDVNGTNIAVGIDRVGIQLTGSGLIGVPMYLFHSESPNPIASAMIAGIPNGRTMYADFDAWIFSRTDGYYLLGYFESDLPNVVQAVGAERALAVQGCSNCFGADYSYAQMREPYLKLTPVVVENPATPGLMTWSSEQTVQLQTWGINFFLSVKCDTTDAILSNRDLIYKALLYQIGCDVLGELSTSDRLNATQSKMQSLAYSALKGAINSKTDTGLEGTLQTTLSDLKERLADITPNCVGYAPNDKTGLVFEQMF